jgi:hypothetical protein
MTQASSLNAIPFSTMSLTHLCPRVGGWTNNTCSDTMVKKEKKKPQSFGPKRPKQGVPVQI